MAAHADQYDDFAVISSTLGVQDGRVCVGEASRGDIGCPTYAPYVASDGSNRHIITDTLGSLIFVRVHRADIQDRDGAPDLLKAVRFRHPWLRHVFADGG